MTYTLNFSIGLGSSNTGLTLNSQLVDDDGVNTGDVLTTGFTEIGNGYYLWHYEDFPDEFRGGVKFFEQGTPGTTLVFGSINPEEAENLDEKITEIIANLDDKVIISINDLRQIIFG